MKPFLVLLLLFIVDKSYTQGEVVKRQKKVKDIHRVLSLAEIEKSYLKIKLNNISPGVPYSATTTTPVRRNIFNLSEQGQKALIEAVNSNAQTKGTLLESLVQPLEKYQQDNSPIDLITTDFIKRFDLKIDNQSINIGTDRIAELEIWITLDGNDEIEFSSFNNFSSKYKTLDFGILSINRVTGFSANVGVNLGNTGSTSLSSTSNSETLITTASDNSSSSDKNGVNGNNTNGSSVSNTSNIGLGYTNSKTVAQQIAIKSEMVVTKGSLNPKEFSIFQDGVPNQDLNDNLSVNVICRAKNYRIKPYFVLTGLFDPKNNDATTDASKLSIKTGYITYPRISKDITAKLSYAFIYRYVDKGGNTVRESDDEITAVYNDNRILTTTQETIIKQNELGAKLVELTLGDPSKGVLYINYYNKRMPLYFKDLIAGLQFVEWLRQTNSTTYKNFALEFSIDGQNFTAYSSAQSISLQPFDITLQ